MTVNIENKIAIIFKGGKVKRYHTRPVLQPQNNAEHQYMVTSLVSVLYPRASAQFIKNCLWHDIYEYETGDMPWAIKRNNRDIKEAITRVEKESIKRYELSTPQSEFEHMILKLAEYFECLLFCLSERYLGNREFIKSEQDCLEQIDLIHLKLHKQDKATYIRSKELQERLMRRIEQCQN